MDDVEVGVLGRQLVQPGGGLVGGAVVDEEDLELVRGEALPEQTVDAVLDVLARVVDRDDDADLDCHAGFSFSWIRWISGNASVRAARQSRSGSMPAAAKRSWPSTL
ncbi:hypothetical protein SGRIM128S_06956 [Streptomyces griseomycini]